MSKFIPEEKISEIKNTSDIVDIVSEVVILKKTGKNHIGLCPFHTEKTPSFTVNREKQIFHCFGCGEGGNVFSFLMKNEGLSFPESVRALARRYGIELPKNKVSNQEKTQNSEKEKIFKINRYALEFFKQCLFDVTKGNNARSYLKERNLTRNTIEAFEIGYAPRGWNHLINYFNNKNISLPYIEKTGLVIKKKESHKFYDRFRDRIIFPIFDMKHGVVGFGGRVLDDSLPKYINSPESLIFNKRRMLFGMPTAKRACREKDTVYIVEGYLDLLALYQHGVKNTVATLGTSLTSEHVRLLRRRFAGRMTLVYDSDEAGIKAAERCSDIFWKEHVDFSKDRVDANILVLPMGYDPDSYIFEKGEKAFRKRASAAPDIIMFLIDCAVKKYGMSVEGKLQIISDMSERLSSIKDNMARQLYIKELSEKIGVDESAILENIRKKLRQGPISGGRFQERIHSNRQIQLESGRGRNEKNKRAHLPGSRLERSIISMLLHFPQISSEIESRNTLRLINNDTLKKLGRFLIEQYKSINSNNEIGVEAENQNLNNYREKYDFTSELINRVDDDIKRRVLASMALENDKWDLTACLRLIKQFESHHSRYKNSLSKEIQVAEETNDHERLMDLLKDKQRQIGNKQKLSGKLC